MEVITPRRDNHKIENTRMEGEVIDIIISRGMGRVGDILLLIMMKSKYWSFSKCFEIGLSSWTKIQFIYVGF